ncbi:MAG: hypothetical protein KBT29_02970 [Prevotellaceae bacterium]|nr:hypothetical protein [Candidatus Minthosoma caballi]
MKRLLTTILALTLISTAFAQRRTASGMLILGTGPEMRAVAPFSNRIDCLTDYANTAMTYARNFGMGVRVYCMPIPTSSEFYAASEMELTYRQKEAIDYCFSLFTDTIAPVTPVSLSDMLAKHTNEPIYSRTDHHWQPLGAYYAAQEFAKVAGVPFRLLDSYNERFVHNFVGTMPSFAKYPALRNWPEDFVYYTPKDVQYSATFIDYTLDRGRQNVISESEEHEADIFREYKDGSSAAYCTFLGGDTKLVSIKTSTHNGRHLLILKDSFGNALPSFLLYSFEQICVVDCRYFTKNIIDYATEQGITDILFANNIGHASNSKTTEMYNRYLTQKKK